MALLDNLFVKKTNFKAGGIILEKVPLSAKLIKESDRFVAPRKMDFRDMCLETSNQFQTSHCAGYATAGYIEFQNWKFKHYPEQIDGDAIYYEAKRIDGYNENGTWVKCAIQAAFNLGLINGNIEYILGDRRTLKFAIHEFGVCIASFNITSEWNSVGKNGKIPELRKSNIMGGHAVLICGYDSEGVYIQNSWGVNWGLYGFGFLGWDQFDIQFQDGVIIRK